MNSMTRQRPLIADDIRPLVNDADGVVSWCAKYMLDEAMEWRY
jgi:hypothetical protein